ncbi:MAG: bacillithiol system redox-active protein YtxJ [Bacillaceae bacterium]|nr:bacillithiol system redox-active protein YtxJ [Bacillaceae bacterium]
MALKKLNTFSEFDELTKEKAQLVIFKNSTTCPISHTAFEEFSKFATESDEHFYYLNVQELRDVSNEIANRYGVKHESPQVLVIRDENVTWHASHRNITYSTVKAAIK